LTPEKLVARLKSVYLPVWLVDLDVHARWQAEAGFNYQVVSHQDKYDQNRGGWTSQQVTEGRVRWEPRLGSLDREYHNHPAPALEEDLQLKRCLGSIDFNASLAYQNDAVRQSFIRLPNRSTQDAWAEVVPSVQKIAADECRQASGADAIRSFAWTPEFSNQNWTLLLLPMYTTYYQDDQGQPQSVLINGQTGELCGARRASPHRANRAALGILGIAGVLFILSLALAAASILVAPLLVIGGIGLMLSAFIALAAVIPVAMVWHYNRSHLQAA
jgi:hypothetical protein